MEEKIQRMRTLVLLLRSAGRAYYAESREIMSNLEYDRLYDELVRLEEETGTVLSGSPTAAVGSDPVSELPKERHVTRMLSLDKRKNVDELVAWLGNEKGLLSWKMDGLTVVLTYEDGELTKAVTRGNGVEGEVITANARSFVNVPLRLAFQGRLILRGEAVITYSDFNRINEKIPDADARYKNPRNLCSGSVRQLDSRVTATRNVRFEAFALVSAEGVDFSNSRQVQFQWLESLGFDVVGYRMVTADTLKQAVAEFEAAIPSNDIPSDGLVLIYDDIAYGESLGSTEKFPRSGMAFKWQDETKETVFKYIEWSPSRTGLLNPVAVFEPVELEGTTVSRASVHNLSILEGLSLGAGDHILVYKANMIIPQIAENLTRSGLGPLPKTCPVCGGEVKVRSENDVKSLYCANDACQAKKVGSFVLFASRDALNIEGLSESTLEKLIGAGFIHEYADLFGLPRYREEIVQMEGFGQKSYENLVASAERARRTSLPKLICGLGISGIGLAGAKALCRAFGNDFEKMRTAGLEEISCAEGIGPVLAQAWVEYFSCEANVRAVDHLLKEVVLEQDERGADAAVFSGKTFVITGSLTGFSNRRQLQEYIEERGGRVTGSVTSKTTYLINNDVTSQSAKNKKARQLGVPILSEEAFLRLGEVKGPGPEGSSGL